MSCAVDTSSPMRPALVDRPLPPTLHPAAPVQIEEDTDRDRYMSPLEAQAYGLIDHIVGGEEAVFKVRGLSGWCMTRAMPCLLRLLCCTTAEALEQSAVASWGPCNHSAGPSPLQIEGSTRAFPKTKEQYVNWGDEDFMDGSRGSRSARLRQGDVLGGSRGAVMRAHVPSSAVGMSMFAGKACCCNGRAHLTCTPQS